MSGRIEGLLRVVNSFMGVAGGGGPLDNKTRMDRILDKAARNQDTSLGSAQYEIDESEGKATKGFSQVSSQSSGSRIFDNEGEVSASEARRGEQEWRRSLEKNKLH